MLIANINSVQHPLLLLVQRHSDACFQQRPVFSTRSSLSRSRCRRYRMKDVRRLKMQNDRIVAQETSSAEIPVDLLFRPVTRSRKAVHQALEGKERPIPEHFINTACWYPFYECRTEYRSMRKLLLSPFHSPLNVPTGTTSQNIPKKSYRERQE